MEPVPVLIVDDEGDFRTLLVEALESLGYGAEGAESAEIAIERVKVKHFPVIFTDLNMPGGLSGLELLKAIQGLDTKAFTILMTGYATTESAIQALKRGAYDFRSPSSWRNWKRASSGPWPTTASCGKTRPTRTAWKRWSTSAPAKSCN